MLGYIDNGKGKHKTICALRGPLVRELFELYASGSHSMRSLTQKMYSRGLTTWAGRPVAKTSIEQMLKNPFYTGLIKINKTGKTYQGGHQPLIPIELFEAVTLQRQGGRRVQKQTRHNHMYRGLWRCGLCEQAMSPERQKGRVYYRCHNNECETKSVQEEMLERAVLTSLKSCCLTKTASSELEKRINKFLKSKKHKADEQIALSQLKRLVARETRLNKSS